LPKGIVVFLAVGGGTTQYGTLNGKLAELRARVGDKSAVTPFIDYPADKHKYTAQFLAITVDRERLETGIPCNMPAFCLDPAPDGSLTYMAFTMPAEAYAARRDFIHADLKKDFGDTPWTLELSASQI
jgi:hypothetical protein